MPGRAHKITPARCNNEIRDKISKLCIKASDVLDISTISRIDGFVTKENEIILIDPNSLTGMGPASFLFHEAAEYGMSHTQLINFLIESELQRYGMVDMVDVNNETEIGGAGKATQVENKIKVVVLIGGDSNEREISLESGRNICYKLSPQKYEIIPVFVNDNMELFKLSQKQLIQNSTREINESVTSEMQIKWSGLPKICDFVFIGLHGGKGESGAVQGTLEMLNLPYNGSGVLASALCMDKFKTNSYLRGLGFEAPLSILISKNIWQDSDLVAKENLVRDFVAEVGFPLILKPHDDGCSFFVKKAIDMQNLITSIDAYFNESPKEQALLEEFVKGIELTVGVFGNENVVALPPTMTVAKKEILSILEKFLPGDGENQTPAPISASATALVQDVMARAFRAVGCCGYARIDCFYQTAEQSRTGKERVVILEFNTLPGMTPATCIFHQAAEIGMKPMEFVDKIVELGLQRSQQVNKVVEPHGNIIEPKAEAKKVDEPVIVPKRRKKSEQEASDVKLAGENSTPVIDDKFTMTLF